MGTPGWIRRLRQIGKAFNPAKNALYERPNYSEYDLAID
jgi:hypothetical protein